VAFPRGETLVALRFWLVAYLVCESLSGVLGVRLFRRLSAPTRKQPSATTHDLAPAPVRARSAAVDSGVRCAGGGRAYSLEGARLRAAGPAPWEQVLAQHDYDHPAGCAADANGRVYVAARDHYEQHGGTELRAYEPDGRLRWSLGLAGEVQTLALGDAGELVLSTASREGGHWIEKVVDGERRWRIESGDEVRAIGPDGTIYGKRHQGTLVALEPDGMERFATSPTTSDISSAALDRAGNIYVTDFQGLYALDGRGVLRWKRTAPRMGDGTTAAEGAVLEGSLVSGGPEREPAIAADGTVYFAAQSLFAFSPDGALRWQFTPETLHDRGDHAPAFFDRTPILARDGTIYATTSDGQVYALTKTGAPLWRFGGAKNELLLGVYLDAQGDLQVVQERVGIRTDRQLLVFDGAEHGPLMSNAWPTRFHDFGNTRHRPAE